MSDPLIQLTEAAEKHIQEILAAKPRESVFRLSVKKTGCSGYMYIPEILAQPHDEDKKIITDNGFALYVDEKCIPLIQGTIVDYVHKKLGQKQLSFNNPNAQGLCGCGESFNLKAEDNE